MSDFHIRIAGPELIFSAAHFITYADGTCEGLHGHDFRVAAELAGPLNPQHYVVDFVALRHTLQRLLGEWDHAVLLPAANPALRVTASQGEVEVRHAQRRWIFPQAECRVLPIANTTAELLAQHVAGRLLEVLMAEGVRPARLRVEVQEMPGLWAGCELTPAVSA